MLQTNNIKENPSIVVFIIITNLYKSNKNTQNITDQQKTNRKTKTLENLNIFEGE